MAEKRKAKTIRQRMDEAKSLAEKGEIDEAITLLLILLRDKSTFDETVELVEAIASLKKQKYKKEHKNKLGEKK